MMNEDNLFNKLRRTPIEGLDDEYRIRWAEFYANQEVYKEWLLRHGWDDKSFIKAGKAYDDKLRQLNNERTN